MNWKVGDYVTAIYINNIIYLTTDSTDSLTLGKDYLVIEINENCTKVINDHCREFGYYHSRFKKSLKSTRKEKLKKLNL